MAAPISTALPTAPSASDAPSVFEEKSFAFVGALEPFRVDIQAQADFVNDNVGPGSDAETVANIAADVSAVAAVAPDVSLLAAGQVSKTELAEDGGSNLVGYSATETVQDILDERISGNTATHHFSIGCIPRCTGGVFNLLNDAGHHPMNVSSISQHGDHIFRVNYAKPATKINSFMIQQDQELAPYGIDIGGDVGLSYANCIAHTNFNAYVNGTTVTANGLLTDDTSAAVANDVLIVYHDQALADDIPVGCAVYNNPANMMMFGFGYSTTKVTATAVSDISGLLRYNGAVWEIILTNNDGTEAAFATAAPTSGGTVLVTHATGSDENIQLTAHGTTYNVAVTNSSKNIFEVAFKDNAGTVITTPDTGMTVWFRRKALVKSTMPADAKVFMRRGNVKVKSSRLSNVTGNNFWVMGDMEG